MEIRNLTEKMFKVPIGRMTRELGRRMNKKREKLGLFNKELENTNNN